MAVELADRDAQLKELLASLNAAHRQELKLRKEQRELVSEKQELKLHVARQLDEERQQLMQETRRRFDEEHQLKEAEKDKKISDLAAKLKEMQRKSHAKCDEPIECACGGFVERKPPSDSTLQRMPFDIVVDVLSVFLGSAKNSEAKSHSISSMEFRLRNSLENSPKGRPVSPFSMSRREA